MRNMTQVNEAAKAIGHDVYLYNGPITRQKDLTVIEQIGEAQKSKQATFILVTGGGDPDAGFKIARYLNERYDQWTMLIPGLCKSAGTLMALGAHELAFTPYGELGPLDIQMSKVDLLGQMQSGLVISDSLNTLEERAMAVFFQTAKDLIGANQGMISFSSASQAAIEAMKAIYAPVLSRIDPEEIGVRSRAMRIAQDYGKRLADQSKNLKGDTLRLLAETYSSHSFVIDRAEACALFERVRGATKEEQALVAALSNFARYPLPEVQFYTLHETPAEIVEGPANDEPANQGGEGHGRDPERAADEAVAAPAQDVAVGPAEQDGRRRQRDAG